MQAAVWTGDISRRQLKGKVIFRSDQQLGPALTASYCTCIRIVWGKGRVYGEGSETPEAVDIRTLLQQQWVPTVKVLTNRGPEILALAFVSSVSSPVFVSQQ
jgi:hypothetical protein